MSEGQYGRNGRRRRKKKKESVLCGMKMETLNTLLQILYPSSIVVSALLFVGICYPIYLCNPATIEVDHGISNQTLVTVHFFLISPSEFSSIQPNAGIAAFFACFVSLVLTLIFLRHVREVRPVKRIRDVSCPSLLDPVLIIHGIANSLVVLCLIGMGGFPMDKSRPSYLLVHLIFELLFYHGIAFFFICWVMEGIIWGKSFKSVPIWFLWQLRVVVAILSVVLVIVFWVFLVMVLNDGLIGVEFKDFEMSIPITYWYESLEYSQFALICCFFLIITAEVCVIKDIARMSIRKIRESFSDDERENVQLDDIQNELSQRESYQSTTDDPTSTNDQYNTSFASVDSPTSSSESSSSTSSYSSSSDLESLIMNQKYISPMELVEEPVKNIIRKIPILGTFLLGDGQRSQARPVPVQRPLLRHSEVERREIRRITPPRPSQTRKSPSPTVPNYRISPSTDPKWKKKRRSRKNTPVTRIPSPGIRFSPFLKPKTPSPHHKPVKRVRYSPSPENRQVKSSPRRSRRKRKKKNRKRRKKRSPRKRKRFESEEDENEEEEEDVKLSGSGSEGFSSSESRRKRMERRKRVRFGDNNDEDSISDVSSGWFRESSELSDDDDDELKNDAKYGLGFGSFGYGATTDSEMEMSTDSVGMPNSFKYLDKKMEMAEQAFDRLVEGVKYIPGDFSI